MTSIDYTHFPGSFCKPCPGTSDDYFCCGYQIVTPMTGCGMYCNYCILQEYLENTNPVVYENFPDLALELKTYLQQHPFPEYIRFGTGELADSLYFDQTVQVCKKISDQFIGFDNAVVEFKTKSAQVESLRAITNPEQCIIGFSLNTPRNISLFEKNTAHLEERLEAVKKCIDMGFWISFHNDPLIRYPEWQKDYAKMIEDVFRTVKNAEKIAWWSMGGFRSVGALKSKLRLKNKHLPLFSQELILGNDNKYRYFRPVRVEMYQHMDRCIQQFDPQTPLYLCMESLTVWTESRMIERIPHGLSAFLDKQVARMRKLV